MPILTAFVKYPEEGAIIGHLITAYATLEIDLLNCVVAARNDFDAALKALFRTRGETQRIDVADALGRQLYCQHNLGTAFSMAIGALRHCLKMRNQYAHCNWYDDRSGCFNG
jgi:hypothetical protein